MNSATLGIDGAVLEGCGIEGCDADDIVELSNGCLCCTVADEFRAGDGERCSTGQIRPTIS